MNGALGGWGYICPCLHGLGVLGHVWGQMGWSHACPHPQGAMEPRTPCLGASRVAGQSRLGLCMSLRCGHRAPWGQVGTFCPTRGGSPAVHSGGTVASGPRGVPRWTPPIGPCVRAHRFGIFWWASKAGEMQLAPRPRKVTVTWCIC